MSAGIQKREQAKSYLSEIPMWTRKKNSFADIREFLEALGNPDRRLKIIHVAGTNGKGSVCAFLTSALLRAGYHTGTFVSPHLVDIRERFLLDGQMVSEELFEDSFGEVLSVTKRMQKSGKRHPTFFEFLFEMALVLFEKQKVDFLILETGLGGRLDTTNVIEHPAACVITSISLDHMQYLGSTVEQIAGEKAGIIKSGCPVIFDTSDPAAARVIEKQADARQALCYPLEQGSFTVLEKPELWLSCPGLIDRELKIPFPAPYQGANEALALLTLKVLLEKGFLDPSRFDRLLEGLETTSWPGRMEEARPLIYLDGAHNPGGIRMFAEAANRIKRLCRGRTLLLFAAVADKDYREMLHILCEAFSFELAAVTHIDSERGLDTNSLKATMEEASQRPVRSFPDTHSALTWLLSEKKEEDVLFCVGSLYLIGEIKSELQKSSEGEEK